MAEQTSRQKQREITEQLRQSLTPDARAVVQLIKLLHNDAKDSLVDAAGDDMLRMQGQAQHLKKLLQMLTVAPPNAQE